MSHDSVRKMALAARNEARAKELRATVDERLDRELFDLRLVNDWLRVQIEARDRVGLKTMRASA